MAALTKDRGTAKRTGKIFSDPVAAGAVLYAGAIVMLDAAGNAIAGATGVGLQTRGVAQQRFDNTGGGAGDIAAESEGGIHRVANDGSIDRTHIGGLAYVVDDQTVAATDGTSTRSAAGNIVDIDGSGVWVDFGV